MKTLGILGGGQLAQMLILAGAKMGVRFKILDPSDDACARGLAEHICAPYQDFNALDRFLQDCDVVTIENENIPAEVLDYIAQKTFLFPDTKALVISQNRHEEKQFAASMGISVGRYEFLKDQSELLAVGQQLGYPFILKTCTHGYDGKGQHLIYNKEQLDAFELKVHETGWIAETLIDFDKEISMIATRSRAGEIVYYDLCENVHEKGILRQTRNIQDSNLFNQAKAMISKIMNELGYVGTLACEFFVKDNMLIFNEMAPRVHNSGHWTIEGACTSQFENHVRAVLGWPLGSTESIGRCIMTNFIGEMPSIEQLLKHKDMHIHDYGKVARIGRKIGHMTKVLR